MSATRPISSSQPVVQPAIHVAPVGNPQIHIAPLSTYRLYIMSSNGEKHSIKLNPQQQAAFETLCARIHGAQGNQLNFSIDLQELTMQNSRDPQLYSNNPDVHALRQFVHDEWRSNFSWSTQLPGHRTSASAQPSFAHASPRLQNLKFSNAEVEKALHGKSFDQKLIQLKRSRAAQHLLEISGTILDQVSELVPNGQLQSANRKAQLLKQKELLDDRLKAVLQFEAFHAADATKQALKTKQTAAKAWIESQSAASRLERVKQYMLPTTDAEEETRFAEDLARLGCKNKREYGALGAKDRAEGPEVFYARLTEAVAVGNEGEIRAVVNGPLFDVVFSRLNTEDQARIKEGLIARAVALSGHLKLSGAEQETLRPVSNDDDRGNVGCFLPTRFDQIVSPRISP